MPDATEDLLAAASSLTDSLSSQQLAGIASVGILLDAPEDTITITVVDRAVAAVLPSEFVAQHRRFRIEIRLGAPIVPAIGRLPEHKPLFPVPRGPRLGGDPIQSARDPKHFGTMTMTAALGYFDVPGSPGHPHLHCNTGRAIVSNNHVIATSDHGVPGDRLHIAGDGHLNEQNHFGELVCYLPLSDTRIHCDLAYGVYPTDGDTVVGAVHELGVFANLRRPRLGEAISKYGARTGLRHGAVTGVEDINVNGRIFKNAFRASGGFGCHGDSGSAVYGETNDFIGIFSWGPDVDCSLDPIGYFWAIEDPGGRGAQKVRIETQS